jgi:hypothetical protein
VKLSRVTELSPLYRGVKGQLPEAFAVLDLQGMVSATDFGFMSTSRSKAVTTMEFMSKTQPNVLWELACREEDEAYYNGADISFFYLAVPGRRGGAVPAAHDDGGGGAAGGTVYYGWRTRRRPACASGVSRWCRTTSDAAVPCLCLGSS